jgi:hypothetical protein
MAMDRLKSWKFANGEDMKLETAFLALLAAHIWATLAALLVAAI